MYYDGITLNRAQPGKESFLLRTVNYTITSPRLPEGFDGFRIVHLSDLHGAVFGENNKLLIHRIRQARPHIIAMTGDMADDDHDSFSSLISLTERLVRHWPVYYTPGNHEQSLPPARFRRLLKKLESLGVMVLDNSWRTISHGGSFVKLYGLTMDMRYYKDPLRSDYVRGIHFSPKDVGKALGKADEGCYRILLAHNPLYYPSYRDWGADLTLSGHIHGGIIRIPGLGGLLSPDLTLFPRYDGGHFTEQGRHLIVSRGLGNHFLVRVMNPPEVAVITLTGQKELSS